MVDDPPHHPIVFHLTKLLDQHLLGNRRYGALQLGEAQNLPAEQMEEDHELPSTLENPQDFFDTFRGGDLGMFGLTFG